MKPMLFNTAMVRALLDDRKTVTRRVVPKQLFGKFEDWFDYIESVAPSDVPAQMSHKPEWLLRHSPYSIGDVLYVRETWTKWDGNYEYKADVDDGYGPFCANCTLDNCTGGCNDVLKWRPSIHMPREAARIFLRVTHVCAERVKDITEEQARAEGFSSRAEFIKVFLEIYPDCTEESYVWVIEFERISKEEVLR